MAVFPFLTGMVTAHFYYRLRTNPNPRTLVFYSCAVFVMVISFFVNPLLRLEFVSNLAVIWFVHRYAVRGEARGTARDIVVPAPLVPGRPESQCRALLW